MRTYAVREGLIAPAVLATFEAMVADFLKHRLLPCSLPCARIQA